jgi:hypothetical protein
MGGLLEDGPEQRSTNAKRMIPCEWMISFLVWMTFYIPYNPTDPSGVK